jgi:hypothetical protein
MYAGTCGVVGVGGTLVVSPASAQAMRKAAQQAAIAHAWRRRRGPGDALGGFEKHF